MLERMSSYEVTEWMAYYNLEPFGVDTQYIGPAITSTILANVNRKKGDKPHKVDEFMPKFEKHEQTVNEMIGIAEMLTVGLGGKDKRQ